MKRLKKSAMDFGYYDEVTESVKNLLIKELNSDFGREIVMNAVENVSQQPGIGSDEYDELTTEAYEFVESLIADLNSGKYEL